MAALNFEFYSGEDKYSDGEIEDTIIEYIKKYSNDYEDAFSEDFSWPVIYHLSNVRKNVVNWYPFKKNSTILEVGAGMGAITSELCKHAKHVTSIELSKKRATAIAERNKDTDNLEIIVGNFQDIILEKKYDYILLNGVLEYSELYIDSDQPYTDFINRLKKNLKPQGKILVAIENKFGLKYWCGAKEDHTGIMYDGINNYPISHKIRTFSKQELESIASECKMHANFYYMFPDYKFPKVIYTDQSLRDKVYADYTPYYCSKMHLLADERRLYREIYNNGMIPFFANSYFLELSQNDTPVEISFVKYNNEYRKSEYDICTYLRKDRFYKKAMTESANQHLKNIVNLGQELADFGIRIVLPIPDHGDIYTERVIGECLYDKMRNNYENGNLEVLKKEFEQINQIIKKVNVAISEVPKSHIFNTYGIEVSENTLHSMTFCSKGVIDIIPMNIMVVNNEYYLIDQEWSELVVPIEYIMYRSIINFFDSVEDKYELKEKLFKKYKINSTLFEKLDYKIVGKVCTKKYDYYYHFFSNYQLIDHPNDIDLLDDLKNSQSAFENLRLEYEKLKQENANLKNKFNGLKEQYDNIKNDYEAIISSKSWKIIAPVRNLSSKLRK